MPLTSSEKLRALLGEDVPVDGTASDTLFAEAEIEDFLDQADEDLDRAAYEGWRVKAARLANLVDSSEGNVQRKFSQLHDSALEMIKTFQRSSSGPTEGRARVGKITRPGVEWS